MDTTTKPRKRKYVPMHLHERRGLAMDSLRAQIKRQDRRIEKLELLIECLESLGLCAEQDPGVLRQIADLKANLGV